MPPQPSRPRRAVGSRLARVVTLCATALATLVTTAVLGQASAHADPGTGIFAAGQRWTGEFADPAVLRVGNVYYAYATATGGDNLPVLSSTDLRTWYVRDAYPANANPGWWAGYNDALPHPAKWALYDVTRNGRSFTRPWAPSVARVGNHYVLAYSVPVSASNPNRRCVSLATSGSPVGPFTDSTTRSIACSTDPNGSNDPQVYAAPDGHAYLIWKNTGVPGSQPTKLWSRQLNAAGTGFAPGSRGRLLLATAEPWEHNVIEGPEMIRYAGRYYLFYSANGYQTASYAVGYAICSSPLGPCRRVQSRPLLATGGSIAGPGAPSPVVGPGGALRLAYAAWDAGHVGYADPQGHRRLHVALLSVGRRGLLGVTSRG